MKTENEHTLTRGLMDTLRAGLPPTFLVEKMADSITCAIPDIYITGNGLITGWEVKHACPRIHWQNDLQWIRMQQREKQGFCRLIVYYVYEGRKWTCIVKPSETQRNGHFKVCPDTVSMNDHFRHGFILDYVRSVHHV